MTVVVVVVCSLDGMETGAWMCAFRRHGHWSSALFRLVLLQHCAHVRSRFSGIVCNQRTDGSEQDSLFLSFFFIPTFPLPSPSFFLSGEIAVVFTRVENTRYRGRVLNFYLWNCIPFVVALCRCFSEMLATRFAKFYFQTRLLFPLAHARAHTFVKSGLNCR